MAGMVMNAWLVVSVIVSLTSASSGLASVVSERAWERVAASLAIFFTLGKSSLYILRFFFHRHEYIGGMYNMFKALTAIVSNATWIDVGFLALRITSLTMRV